MKEKPQLIVFNVKDYGAIGGCSGADDTAAIQRCIDEALKLESPK